MSESLDRRLIALVLAASLAGCAGTPKLGPQPDGMLLPCPPRPNCVSTEATDEAHSVGPFVLAESANVAWRAVREVVSELPRTDIVDSSGDYLHAECRSAIFRFVDDLEMRLDRKGNAIVVRSASRLGYSDLGVNRARVESLRERLHAAGVIR